MRCVSAWDTRPLNMEGFDELQDVEAGYNNNFLKIFF